MDTVTINKHFKINQQAIEKSKFIREIFEIDEIIGSNNTNTLVNNVNASNKIKSMSV